ncbi:hypothetical protein M0657_009544 [Pyricularia oryzae]|nr:hypothetical protein M0657_009544 [Pyricularia oryzae]KAI7917770.1 hypothetical protein M9X92_007240 [Pyricularia oryzae]
MALSGFRHFLVVVSLCTPKTGGGKGGFWRPSGAGGPPWDWRLTWGCGVQRFLGLFEPDASKLTHIANNASHPPALARQSRARFTCLQYQVCIRTPGWSRRGIVIAIRQIRPFQHHGHLSAVLCSAAGGDYISRQAQSSADLPKRIETGMPSDVFWLWRQANKLRIAQHGGTPEEHRRDHSLEAL